MQIFAALIRWVHIQLAPLFLWGTVSFAGGVGVYFALKTEPPFAVLILLGGFGVLGALVFVFYRTLFGVLVLLLALFCLGVCCAGMRAHWVAAPVLERHFYGQVQGRVVGVDVSASQKTRVLMDQVVLDDVKAAKTPAKVRITLHNRIQKQQPQIGQTIKIKAHLSPPPGMAEPNGFDFKRHAWFLRLGAVGYSRDAFISAKDTDAGGWRIGVQRLRYAWAKMLRNTMPANTSGVAIAITAGLRGDIEPQTAKILRDANLSHLLAISGLHMGLITVLLFSGLRALCAAFPVVALHYPIRQICAALALFAGFLYLVFSGGSIATERAFVMAAIILGAVILSKRAITLRAVAIAAIIVLLLRAESIFSSSFQMSFAATIALVYVFSLFTQYDLRIKNKLLRWILLSALSAFVAGAATAPFVAAHFNNMSHYGVLSNMLAIPLMAFVVMPGVIIAAMGTLFDMAWPGLFLMDFGLSLIINIAHFVSNLPNATRLLPSPPAYFLPLLSFCAICVVILQGYSKIVAFCACIAVFALWSGAKRPDILISNDAFLVGVISDGKRALNRAKGAGFVARVWLENDADAASQSTAAARHFPTDKVQWFHRGQKPQTPCDPKIIYVFNDWKMRSKCPYFNKYTLSKKGAVAGYYNGDGTIKWITSQQSSGQRLWHGGR